jgi:hypothetical protein
MYSDPSGFVPEYGTDQRPKENRDIPLQVIGHVVARNNPNIPPSARQAAEQLRQFNPINPGDGKAFLPTTIALAGFIAPEGKAADAAVTLFRAVGENELKDIVATGMYRLGRGNEVKYFSPTLAQAQNFAAIMSSKTGQPYSITSAVFHISDLPSPINVIGEGTTYVLDASHFPFGPVRIHK